MKIQAPTYTQTPNELFDHWLPLLNEAELKVLLVIMRKTFGWHKTHDVISVSQLAKITGMLEETVIKAAKSLQNKGVITREVSGPIGKQQTTYSLIVNEDSNNSYPSVQPRTPLGSNPRVQTEAQKKKHNKENIQNKQQHGFKKNAADFIDLSNEKKPIFLDKSTQKSNESQMKVWDCLKAIDIPMHDKVETTTRYDEERVKKGISWATHPKNPPKKCLAASIKHACKNGFCSKEFEQKEESIYENLKKKFKNGDFYNNAECFFDSTGIAFVRGMLQDQVKFDKFFSWNKLEELCEKFQIKFSRTA